MVVLLMGADRSGTSFYARSLALMGAYFGPDVSTESTRLNLKGQYENALANAISNRLFDVIEPKRRGRTGLANKLYWKYMSYGKDTKWYKYYTFYDDPEWVFPSGKGLNDIDGATLSDMERLLKDLDNGGVGVIKQPGMLFSFPFWREMLKRLGLRHKIIAVFRNPVSVARSRANQAKNFKMPVMSDNAYINEWTIKNRLLLKCVEESEKAGIEVMWNDFDWPQDKMIKRLEENCGRLGLGFDKDRSRDLYDPDLKHYSDRVYDTVKNLGDAEALKVYDELLRRSR